MEDLRIDPRITLPSTDFTWTAVRSSGPGGQNVNKVSTSVELRFDLAGTQALREDVKTRLRALARHRLDAEGRLCVTSQATRSQERNLADALDKVRDLVLQALEPPRPRKPTKPTFGSKVRRLVAKQQRSDVKQNRGRVRDA